MRFTYFLSRMVHSKRWFPHRKTRRYDDADLSNQIEWVGGDYCEIEKGAGEINTSTFVVAFKCAEKFHTRKSQ